MAPRSSFRIVTDDVRAIRVLREKKRLSVNKAAPVIGTNKSTLTALENGRINLSRKWIEKILKGYRTSWEEFERLKEQRLSSKETLIDEIRNEAAKLNYEKLQTIGSFLLVLIVSLKMAVQTFYSSKSPMKKLHGGLFKNSMVCILRRTNYKQHDGFNH